MSINPVEIKEQKWNFRSLYTTVLCRLEKNRFDQLSQISFTAENFDLRMK